MPADLPKNHCLLDGCYDHGLHAWPTSTFPQPTCLSLLIYLIPVTSWAIIRRITQNKTRHSITFLCLDALNAGALITITSFTLVGSMLLAMILFSTSVYLFGFAGIVLVLHPTLTAMIASHFFAPVQASPVTASDATFVSLLGATVYMGFLALNLRKRENDFRIIQDNARQQKLHYTRLASSLSKYLLPQVWESIFSGRRSIKLEPDYHCSYAITQ